MVRIINIIIWIIIQFNSYCILIRFYYVIRLSFFMGFFLGCGTFWGLLKALDELFCRLLKQFLLLLLKLLMVDYFRFFGRLLLLLFFGVDLLGRGVIFFSSWITLFWGGSAGKSHFILNLNIISSYLGCRGNCSLLLDYMLNLLVKM